MKKYIAIILSITFLFGILLFYNYRQVDLNLHSDSIFQIQDKNECPYSDHGGDIYCLHVEFENEYSSDLTDFSFDDMDFKDFSVRSAEVEPTIFPIEHNHTYSNAIYFLFKEKSIDKNKAISMILKEKYKYRYKFKFDLIKHSDYIYLEDK